MNPEHLPIRVRLEWPAGIVQYGSATKPNVQEFNAGGDRYVTVTAKLDPPFDHLAHAKAALDQEDTMTTYTAEDFAHASIATRGTHDVARRVDPGSTLPWTYGDSEWEDDQGMTEHGWVPVREHNPHATDDLEELVDDLNDRFESKREMVDVLTARIREMTEERAAPLSLDTLREAWEQAEASEDCRVGDVLIDKISDADEYVVWTSTHGIELERARILHRAPRREPWADLLDVLHADHGDVIAPRHTLKEVAQALHAKGVRVVTGGDEK